MIDVSPSLRTSRPTSVAAKSDHDVAENVVEIDAPTAGEALGTSRNDCLCEYGADDCERDCGVDALQGEREVRSRNILRSVV